MIISIKMTDHLWKLLTTTVKLTVWILWAYYHTYTLFHYCIYIYLLLIYYIHYIILYLLCLSLVNNLLYYSQQSLSESLVSKRNCLFLVYDSIQSVSKVLVKCPFYSFLLLLLVSLRLSLQFARRSIF